MTEDLRGPRTARPRARPLSPDERRERILSATVPLLYDHGRGVTSRLIAEAAGIAEGTIFRVFATKEELVDAAVARAFEPGDLVARLEEIDPDLPLEDRLVRMVSILQQRFRATTGLLHKMGLVGPPDHLHDSPAAEAWRTRLEGLLVGVVGEDGTQLAVPPEELVRLLRLLTFAGSHHKIADGRLLSPEQIVHVVLHGTLLHGTRKD